MYNILAYELVWSCLESNAKLFSSICRKVFGYWVSGQEGLLLWCRLRWKQPYHGVKCNCCITLLNHAHSPCIGISHKHSQIRIKRLLLVCLQFSLSSIRTNCINHITIYSNLYFYWYYNYYGDICHYGMVWGKPELKIWSVSQHQVYGLGYLFWICEKWGIFEYE